MTAQDAIDRSIRNNEIVTLGNDPQTRAELQVECDDDVQNGTIQEFWGRDDDGREWRVHMRGS